MSLVEPIRAFVNDLIRSGNYKWLLSTVKGLRNGVVYGAKIRFPHALVMTFLFNPGTLQDKLRFIIRATYLHARNLAKFVGTYKLLTGTLAKLNGGKRMQWHAFAVAFAVGYYVFGENNNVNMQINLYLLSRITIGAIRLLYEKQYIPQTDRPVFPWFAAVVWGIVLWMFEYHPRVLQPSLQSSMTYLYQDSDRYKNFDELLLVNKL